MIDIQKKMYYAKIPTSLLIRKCVYKMYYSI